MSKKAKGSYKQIRIPNLYFEKICKFRFDSKSREKSRDKYFAFGNMYELLGTVESRPGFRTDDAVRNQIVQPLKVAHRRLRPGSEIAVRVHSDFHLHLSG